MMLPCVFVLIGYGYDAFNTLTSTATVTDDTEATEGSPSRTGEGMLTSVGMSMLESMRMHQSDGDITGEAAADAAAMARQFDAEIATRANAEARAAVAEARAASFEAKAAGFESELAQLQLQLAEMLPVQMALRDDNSRLTKEVQSADFELDCATAHARGLEAKLKDAEAKLEAQSGRMAVVTKIESVMASAGVDIEELAGGGAGDSLLQAVKALTSEELLTTVTAALESIDGDIGQLLEGMLLFLYCMPARTQCLLADNVLDPTLATGMKPSMSRALASMAPL
jgi:hypothetical protein